MSTLFDENRFESEIDSKVKTIVKNEIPATNYYSAKVIRKDSEGIWWVRLDGNDEETPVLVNKVDMSVGDMVTVTVRDHKTIVDGNLTSPPMSAINAQNYVDTVVARNIEAVTADIGYLQADVATIGYAQIEDADITNARIQNLVTQYTSLEGSFNVLEANALTANSAVITNLEAQTAKVENLTTEDLEATVGYIIDLTADNITAADIIADHADITDLEADNAIIKGRLTAAEGNITNLTSENVAITGRLDAAEAVIDNLDANYAHITYLDATTAVIDNAKISYADVQDLDANYAQIDMSNVNNAWILNGTIRDAAITNEMVGSISANKLTAGTIDASNINVANLRADTLIVNKLNGQPVIGGYVAVDSTAPGYAEANPSALGWYEIVNGQMVLSQDTTTHVETSGGSGLDQDESGYLVLDPATGAYSSPAAYKAYYRASTSVALYDQAYIDGLETNLSNRIDGAIETFTGSTVPTLVNYPYTDWYKPFADPPVDNRAEHVGDIYYVIGSYDAVDSTSTGYAEANPSERGWYELSGTEYVLTEDVAVVSGKVYYAPGSKNGYCYRFFKDTNHQTGQDEYGWILLKDSDVTAALAYIGDMGSLSGEYTLASFITHTDSELSSKQMAIDILRSDLGSHENYTTNSVSQQLYENSSTITSIKNYVVGQYAVSTTASDQAAKTATIRPAVTGWELDTGVSITVKFENANTAASPTLNVNNTGAKPILDDSGNALGSSSRVGTAVAGSGIVGYANTYPWGAGSSLTFVYDGANWRMQDPSVDELTRYSESVSETVNSIVQTSETNTARIAQLSYNAELVENRASEIEQNLDGITTRVTRTEARTGVYAVCSSTASATAKSATLTPATAGPTYWQKTAGSTVTVKFVNGNTNTAPTLNVGSTGASYIRSYTASALSSDAATWKAGTTLTFVYNGTYWLLQDSSVSERVTLAESTIVQHADMIAARVEKNGVIAAINLSAEEDDGGSAVKISASKVDIEGAAIFSSGRLSQSSLDAAYDAAGAATAAQQAEAAQRKATYGTSTSSASSQAKTATCEGFSLYSGATVTVNFSNSNTYSSGKLTLNVNSTGAKDVWVSGSLTSSSNQLLWGSGALITFTYDGTQWVAVSEPRAWYGSCDINGGTAAKTSSIDGAVVCKGATFNVQMANANSVANPTFNVSSTGAKAIYIGGARPSATSEYNWTAGATVDFVFDGQYYRGGDASALAKAKNAQDVAATAKSTADGAASRVQRIYRRESLAQTGLTGPTTWLASSGSGYGNWSLSVPQLTSDGTKYPFLYTCVQTQSVAQQVAGNDACSCSQVLLDDATTVIDGGSIITGSVTANQITVNDLIGTYGKINLHDGTFEYGDSAGTGDGISWDGDTLTISGSIVVSGRQRALSDIAEAADSSATLEDLEDLDNYVRGYSTYVLTEDTVALNGVTYYSERSVYTPVDTEIGESVNGLYEKQGNDYVLTSDTQAVSGKIYYSLAYEYDDAEVAVGDSVEGLYVLTNNSSLYGQFSEIASQYQSLEERAETLEGQNTAFSGWQEYINESYTSMTDRQSKTEDTVGSLSSDLHGDIVYTEVSIPVGHSVIGLYEYVDGEYVPTTDEVASAVKQYYEEGRSSGLIEKVAQNSEDLSTIGSAFYSVLKIEDDKVSVGYVDPDTGEFVSDNYHTEMTAEGVAFVYKDPDNEQDVVVARYGREMQLGALDGTHMVARGDRLAFVSANGTEVAYIDVDPVTQESVFYMTRSVVMKDMFFGDGLWKWYKRSNNNMGLKWMGAS